MKKIILLGMMFKYVPRLEHDREEDRDDADRLMSDTDVKKWLASQLMNELSFYITKNERILTKHEDDAAKCTIKDDATKCNENCEGIIVKYGRNTAKRTARRLHKKVLRSNEPKSERIVKANKLPVSQELPPHYSFTERYIFKRATKCLYRQKEAQKLLARPRELKVNHLRAAYGRVTTNQTHGPIYKDAKAQIGESKTSSGIVYGRFTAMRAIQHLQRGKSITKERIDEITKKGNDEVYCRLYEYSKLKQELGKKKRDEIAEASKMKMFIPAPKSKKISAARGAQIYYRSMEKIYSIEQKRTGRP